MHVVTVRHPPTHSVRMFEIVRKPHAPKTIFAMATHHHTHMHFQSSSRLKLALAVHGDPTRRAGRPACCSKRVGAVRPSDERFKAHARSWTGPGSHAYKVKNTKFELSRPSIVSSNVKSRRKCAFSAFLRCIFSFFATLSECSAGKCERAMSSFAKYATVSSCLIEVEKLFRGSGLRRKKCYTSGKFSSSVIELCILLMKFWERAVNGFASEPDF